MKDGNFELGIVNKWRRMFFVLSRVRYKEKVPWEIEPQTFTFLALMFYLWAIEIYGEQGPLQSSYNWKTKFDPIRYLIVSQYELSKPDKNSQLLLRIWRLWRPWGWQPGERKLLFNWVPEVIRNCFGYI